METIRRQSELPQSGRAYVFGAGKAGETIYALVAGNPDLEIVGFIDNSKRGVLCGRPIHSFDDFLARREGDEAILIASMYVAEIGKQLKTAGVNNLINTYPILQIEWYERRRAQRALVTAVMLFVVVGYLLFG